MKCIFLRLKWNRFDFSLPIIILLLLPFAALTETAVYDPTDTAPRCTTGISPCNVPQSLINGRDNMSGGTEPNQPNTLAASPCADGGLGSYHTDESLDSFIVTDLSGSSQFAQGDTIRVDATVWCLSGDSLDSIYVFQSDSVSSPSWNYVGTAACPDVGEQTISVTFNLGFGAGDQAVRVAFYFNSSALSCDFGPYNDRDDLVLKVFEAGDIDGDGMPDWWEDLYACVDSLVGDSLGDGDTDGLLNIGEYNQGTDPCDPDTDGDGLNDFEEINTYTTDPLNPDSEGDGMPDGWEVAYSSCGLDPLAGDSLDDPDNDNAANLLEFGNSTDPCVAQDTDGDGMPDWWEDLYACVNSLAGDSLDDGDTEGLLNLDEFNQGTDPCDLADPYNPDGLAIDCNDGNSAINPGAPEITCDAFDQNCNGNTTDDAPNTDGDARDVCNPADPGDKDGLAADECDSDINNWTSFGCANCMDVDSDTWYIDCDSYNTINGPDQCFMDENNWSAFGCAMCSDGDGDSWYASCDAYNTISGPDQCSSDVNNWTGFGCFNCMDNDGDAWYADCDAYTTINGPDCNEGDSAINPGASEIACDGVDQNCNGNTIDEAPDVDGDSYDVCDLGDPLNPDGRTADCNDGNSIVNPGQIEVTCDGLDNDCDALTPDDKDDDNDGLSYCLEEIIIGCLDDLTADTDGDGLCDGATSVGAICDAGENLDGDSGTGLSDNETDPCDPDTDGDGMYDGWEVIWGASCGLDPLVGDSQDNPDGDAFTNLEEYGNSTDPCVDEGGGVDSDGDGLSDFEEGIIGTEPDNPDTDGDGVNDGDEYILYFTDPTYWDSDDDIPDGYEILQAGRSVDPLDPLNPFDGGTSDFDSDTNPNVHEYWNLTDPWVANPVCGEGCFCWGDAGGDGVPDPTDIVELGKAVRGLGPDYTNVLPASGMGQDLDGDGTPSPLDITELKKLVRGLDTAGLGSRPNTLVVMEQPGGTVKVGDTCHVTVGVLNDNSTYSPSFGVIFKIGASSTGTASILGGEGTSSPGRYDVSEDAGTSRIVLKIESAGTIEVEATIPGCGVPTTGRYCPVLNALVVTIIGE